MATFSIGNYTPNFSGSNSYAAAAQLNRDLFNAQQQGWAQNLAQYQAGMQGVTSGWQNLTGQAMGLLRGTNRANLQDIANKYTALSGQMSNQMIDRGLGNSTVQQAMQIGLRQSQAREATRSRGEFGQLLANTLGSLGGAGLAAQERGVSGASDIYRGYLGFLNSVNAPYPQGSMYGADSSSGTSVIGGGRPTGGFQPSYFSAAPVDSGGFGGGPGDPSFYARAPVSGLGYFNGDTGDSGNPMWNMIAANMQPSMQTMGASAFVPPPATQLPASGGSWFNATNGYGSGVPVQAANYGQE